MCSRIFLQKRVICAHNVPPKLPPYCIDAGESLPTVLRHWSDSMNAQWWTIPRSLSKSTLTAARKLVDTLSFAHHAAPLFHLCRREICTFTPALGMAGGKNARQTTRENQGSGEAGVRRRGQQALSTTSSNSIHRNNDEKRNAHRNAASYNCTLHKESSGPCLHSAVQQK